MRDLMWLDSSILGECRADSVKVLTAMATIENPGLVLTMFKSAWIWITAIEGKINYKVLLETAWIGGWPVLVGFTPSNVMWMKELEHSYWLETSPFSGKSWADWGESARDSIHYTALWYVYTQLNNA